MKILLVKLSSMGDIFHTYPAISDLKQIYPDARVDWLVDQQFAEIAGWHPGVEQIHAVPLRALKKNASAELKQQLRETLRRLRQERYDYIIDAQGLMKSAWLSYRLNGVRYGYDWSSARESLASLCYQHKLSVAVDQHAVDRIRQLFAQVLGYQQQLLHLPESGLDPQQWLRPTEAPARYGLVFPGTTWLTKHWRESYWLEFLDRQTIDDAVYVGWGSPQERLLAERISQQQTTAKVFSERLSFAEMARWIAHASWVVGVDTGFVHLASAMQKPVLGLFGPTTPKHTGVTGHRSDNLCSELPCFPCRKKICKIADDPDSVVCMEQMKPQTVLDKAELLFKS
ncbi:lipopolysaccharide heptosyltransferase I [Gynuella sp.]|uniref:lipopolysaccharide heptosyltransferase I n=1 Tax=Gynuella sp. TaxID=2969146 RepID=UPI003D0964C0